jgi:23S rRNA pseudouridine1911/1915/1917 synthase
VSEEAAFVFRLHAPPSAARERLDRFVTEHVPDTSRSFIQRLIEAGEITVNGAPSRPSYRIEVGDEVVARIPPPERSAELSPAEIPVPIVYEDDDVLVFDKPAGLVVHPAPGHEHGTLVNALRWLRPDAVLPGDVRPGIVHRLDKDTSGLIVVAKHESARLRLTRQWQERSVLKKYTALVVGSLPEQRAIVDAPIGRDPHNRKRMAVVAGGRPAVTRLEVIARYRGYSLLDVTIETGRTHQIRVHCAFIKHPVAGDWLYGATRGELGLKRHFLHARELRFELPSGPIIHLCSPLAPDLVAVLEKLEAEQA